MLSESPCAVLKRHCVKKETIDDLLQVIAWSFGCALANTMPAVRHDGAAWKKSDHKRSKQAGQAIGLAAVLVEVRADWACLKNTFRFPGWRETSGCCFKCKVTPPDIRQCDTEASWKQPCQRHDHWSLMAKILSEGHTMSPIFSAPFLTTGQFIIDWLHCCDLGVGQDWLGNLFNFILSKMPGRNKELRLKALFHRMQQFYAENGTESCLDDLTPTMIKKDPKSPYKLRSKAAETRGLIPFARALAEELLLDTDPVESSVKKAAVLMDSCYSMLSTSTFSQQILGESCRQFCLIYVALGDHFDDDYSFKIKPKFHLWQELCLHSSGCPSTAWTYRDEDFGGTVAKLARRRGGKNTALCTARLVLNNFKAKESVPAVV